MAAWNQQKHCRNHFKKRINEWIMTLKLIILTSLISSMADAQSWKVSVRPGSGCRPLICKPTFYAKQKKHLSVLGKDVKLQRCTFVLHQGVIVERNHNIKYVEWIYNKTSCKSVSVNEKQCNLMTQISFSWFFFNVIKQYKSNIDDYLILKC